MSLLISNYNDEIRLTVSTIDRCELLHNLPTLSSNSFYVVQFFNSVVSPDFLVIVRDSKLVFLISQIKKSQAYKLIALKIDNGINDGLWWVDNYIYNPDQVNIEFKSKSADSGTGDLKQFSGSVKVAGRPAQRLIIAYGIDGDTPIFLAKTISDALGRYTLEWRGYAGNVLMTALDDYGVPWVANKAHGVGERIHPTAANGYVYQVVGSGTLGDTEPSWPAEDGAQVTSGTAQLVAFPYYQPQTIGPHVIS